MCNWRGVNISIHEIKLDIKVKNVKISVKKSNIKLKSELFKKVGGDKYD